MNFKRSGRRVFGVEFNKAEEEAVDREIEKRLADYTRKHNIEFAAMVLYNLREQFGFGETRLRRFYDMFDVDIEKLITRYEMGEEDSGWLCTHKLKEDGIDVAKWYEENHIID